MTTNTINYAKLASPATDTHTNARDAPNHAAANLAVIEGDREGPPGHHHHRRTHRRAPIRRPVHPGRKDETAQRASAYYMAANKFKEYTQGTMRHFEDTTATSTAPALTTETHHLVHQDNNMGAPPARTTRQRRRGRNSPSIPTSLRHSRLSPIPSAAPTAPRTLSSIAHLTPSTRQ